VIVQRDKLHLSCRIQGLICIWKTISLE
jgi:hypothetical protein